MRNAKPCNYAYMLISMNIPRKWSIFIVFVGDLNEERSIRKRQQIENMATHISNMAKAGDTIVDFCAGGGHLGIVMAYLRPDCHVSIYVTLVTVMNCKIYFWSTLNINVILVFVYLYSETQYQIKYLNHWIKL